MLLPLSERAFDGACAPVAPALRLRALLGEAAPPAARSRARSSSAAAGGRCSSAFASAPEATDGVRNPLDRYTRPRSALRRGRRWARPASRTGSTSRSRTAPCAAFPAPRPRGGIGAARAAGPANPSRARAVVGVSSADSARGRLERLAPATPLGDACAGCPAPCVPACPAGAVRLTGSPCPNVTRAGARRLLAICRATRASAASAASSTATPTSSSRFTCGRRCRCSARGRSAVPTLRVPWPPA